MTPIGTFQILAYIAITLPLAIFMSCYIAKIFLKENTLIGKILSPIEKCIYKVSGINETEQTWGKYAKSMLVFNFIGLLFLFLILKFQNLLPANSANFPGLNTTLALNTAVSFITNTNWQAYAGESTLSYFSQAVGLAVQNFLSAATGLALAIALIRGISSNNGAGTIGNFYVDLTRSVLYILLPIAIVAAILLNWQGVPQSLNNAVSAQTIEGITQTIPQGPVASQVAIKQLGTNGGGFFGANASHPYENPNPLSNLIQIILMLLIPMALPITYGKMLKDKRQGWTIFAAMSIFFIAGLIVASHAESKINPALSQYGITSNMEGKETRFGVTASTFWSVATTATSSGAVNSMHDSFMPLSGLVQISNIMLSAVVFGGVGSGLYGMIIFVIMTVFIAGLMVGRTPEYMGKKIETYEIKMAMFAMLTMPLGILALGAISICIPEGASSITATGAHGLTQFLYAHASATGNNGSAFGGFIANTNYSNLMLSFEMLVGRFLMVIPMLAIAGSLARKNIAPASEGTFPTHGLQFALLLVGVVLIVDGLTFFPVLILGPGLEHLLMAK